jgi:drug/metabolite transporter (DMT)-like permease
VATYAYVNPLIAVLLGCTVGREPFSREVVMAGGLIIAAVVLVLRGTATRTKPELETAVGQPKACPTSE